MRHDITPAFIDGSGGRLFVLLRRPAGARTSPAVMVVPPFGEEMNKCRPMLTEVARGLAARGTATVLPDLRGTGDSEGEFREGDWESWQDDLTRTAGWASRAGCEITGLLCIRLGCILGAQAAAALASPVARTVFWQPVPDGARFLAQFMRLRVAASVMSDVPETVAGLRARLESEGTLEIAGYELSARLAAQIERAQLAASIGPQLGSLCWIETVRGAGDPMPEAAARAMREATMRGASVAASTVTGEPYWSSVEIVRIPGLVERTVSAFAGSA